MSKANFSEEFKIDAVKQITERGYSVSDVSKRLGVSSHNLYKWKKQFSKPSSVSKEEAKQQTEIARLKRELARVTEERDILKKPRCTSPKMPSEVRLYRGKPI